MIEDVKEKRIKIFEIIFVIIIGLMLLWLLIYEIFFKEANPQMIIDDEMIEEANKIEIDEKNIYNIYTTLDNNYTLTIVKTSDRKAYTDAREEFQKENDDKYINTKIAYYGYLNSDIFEITDVKEELKYTLFKGKLINDDKVLYNFIVNNETKKIEEGSSKLNRNKRFFIEDDQLYDIINVNENYFFTEEYNDNVVSLYTSDWQSLGYVKKGYIPSNNAIKAYIDYNLTGEAKEYDFSGNEIIKNGDIVS